MMNFRRPFPGLPLRVSAVLAATVLVLLLAAAWGCGREKGGERWNLVLITLDTLRADHLGCYGYIRARTPNIDGFANEALRYQCAYSVINTTLASHAAMMTGRYPQGLGIPRNSFPLARDIPTLAELLRDEGYTTAAFVSASSLHSSMGLARGFETYDEDFGILHLNQEQRRAESTTTAAGRWLGENGAGKPFFLWVHYFDPHYPYAPPPPFDTIYGSDYQGPADGSMEYLATLRLPQARPTPEDLQQMVDLYDGEIAYLDHWLGKLIERLEAPGIGERTLVVITADHGEQLLECEVLFNHGLYLYQPSVAVPLLIRFPEPLKVTPAAASTVQTLDILPTMLAAAGVTSPPDSGGRSLIPLPGCREPAAGQEGPRPAFAEASRPWHVERGHPDEYQNLRKAAMVVSYPWKLVETPYLHQVELYNLDQDPGERNNVAGGNPELAADLRRLISGWRDGAQDGSARPDDENLRRLEALGYVEGSPDSP